MARYELDKWDIKTLYELWKKNRLNLTPDYQRSKVWTDYLKFDLIDSVLHDWPMGVVMINAISDVDEDGEQIERYEVVDGQQRLTTLFEYRDGAQSAVSNKPPAKYPDFKPYSGLSPARQDRFDSYKIALALMKDYEEDEILDIYSRLQHSKPLVIGEKVKALRSQFKSHIHEIVEHRIFKISPSYRHRDSHWNLASVFFKAVYRDNPYDRQEYERLEEFLRHESYNQGNAKRALDHTKRLLNFGNSVLEEVQEIAPNFREIGNQRLLKWLFAALQGLIKDYGLSGREHLVAKGLVDYYRSKDMEGSDEGITFYRTGRSGRIDTQEVKECLEQLMNRIVLAAEAEPLDPKRLFTVEQRRIIFQRSGGRCVICQIELSTNNFHADHIKLHSQGGQTTIENGQALCTKCNRNKGKTIIQATTN